MNKEQFLASCLHKAGILDLYGRYKKALPGSGTLPVLAYHRVYDFDPDRFLFDEEIVSAFTEEFDRQMHYVKENFDVLSFHDLKECLATGKRPRRPLIITFDDGYKDNYTNAYPILKKHSLPATIFLTTRYIGRSEPFWFEKVAYWIKATMRKRFRLKADREYEYQIEDNRHRVIRSIQTLLKTVDESSHKDLMSQLESELDVEIEGAEQVQTLSWEDVREMSQNGIEFGSHSVSHLNIAKLSDFRLRREIIESKETIEKAIGKRVRVFSYPFGGGHAFNEKVKALLRQAGYEFAVSYIHGVNKFRNLDAYTLRRIHVERDQDFACFKSTLLFPEIFL